MATCKLCASCCKKLKPILYKEDVERIAKHLNIPENDFIKKYLVKEKNNEFWMKYSPCPFLKKNRCVIYKARPEECRLFPCKELDRKSLELYSKVCPNVKNQI